MGDLINQFFQFLQQLILPNWSDLIALLPWVLVALVILSLLGFACAWRRDGGTQPIARPEAAAGRRATARRPSARAVALAVRRADRRRPAALLLRAAAQGRGRQRDSAVQPAAARPGPDRHARSRSVGWLWDAMREWRATAEPGHTPLRCRPARARPWRWCPAPSAAVRDRRAFGAAEQIEPSTSPSRHVEPPPGVHMPGPSPWPFFAPDRRDGDALRLHLQRRPDRRRPDPDAHRDHRLVSRRRPRIPRTEAVGHAVPATRDPYKAWPRRLVPIYVGVIVALVR